MKNQIMLFLLLVTVAQAQFRTEEMLTPHVYTNAAGQTLLYRLAAPQFPAPERKYPVVLFLHGSGESGTDNQKQIKVGLPALVNTLYRRKKVEPVIIVAPQCQSTNSFVKRLMMRPEDRMPERPTATMSLIFELLDQLIAECQADPARIYVTGLSLGGFATWEAVQRRPQFFAAAAPVCGGADLQMAARLKHLPVWMFHGSEDKNVPVACSRNMYKALKSAGNRRAKYIEYEGAGHDVWNRAYGNAELVEWLMRQRNTAKPWWRFW